MLIFPTLGIIEFIPGVRNKNEFYILYEYLKYHSLSDEPDIDTHMYTSHFLPFLPITL